MRIYTHELFLEHRVPEGHPERPARLSHVLAHLDKVGLLDANPLAEAQAAEAPDILRAHSSDHLAYIESMIPLDGAVPLDPDTWMSAHSMDAALLAAGAVIQGVDDTLEGLDNRVFCAVRPPGHHAERTSAMGFCLFNSIAVGALHALTNPDINRVVVLDFDVHHGNGTVDICQHHPEVLVCSSFQHPHYPNRLFDVDAPNIVNSPLAAGSGGEEFRRAVEEQWLPAIEAHAPDLILVSAGFDAHARDPLASLNLTEEDFAWVTNVIVGLADRYSSGRVVSTLEGGYDLDALATSVQAHLEALTG